MAPCTLISTASSGNAALIPARISSRKPSYTARTVVPEGAAKVLRRNLAIYGLGGLVLPFAGIKAIDLLLVAAGLA